MRFVEAAQRRGVRVEPRLFSEGTKTAQDAAAAVGCEVGQIVKSLVFVADDGPVLALIGGDRRVDLGRLALASGARRVRRASLDEVRTASGYVAGGTPPFGHDRALPAFADVGLRSREELWAAAGTPTTVFPITPEVLLVASGATWVDLAEGG
jgi:prolyl-tRNA editing enzyme YbaK/EbsC (Cys-tRNA(Pro) deacylase)